LLGPVEPRWSTVVELEIPIPSFTIPQSMTFAHRTQIGHVWTPVQERILLPEQAIGPARMDLRVFDGDTGQLGVSHPTKNPLRMLRRRQMLDMTGMYIADGRGYDERNIAHHILNICSSLLLAKKLMETELGRPVKIHLVFRPNASRITREVYRLLGIPVIFTDARVKGRIVDTYRLTHPNVCVDGELLHRGGCQLLGILPELYGVYPFSKPAAGSPEKIFISRRSSRRISNELEIRQMLEDSGFKTCYFEEIPIPEQWGLVAGAYEIVAIHGAAMSALVFNRFGLSQAPGDRSGLRVIEVFGPGYCVDVYRHLTAVLNGHWCGVRGQIRPEVVRDLDLKLKYHAHLWTPFRVDPKTIEMALKYSETACHSQAVTAG
jgi:hypothetical protein